MPRTATTTENNERRRVVTATAAKDGALLVPPALRKIVRVEPYDMFVVKIVEQSNDEFTISFKKLQ